MLDLVIPTFIILYLLLCLLLYVIQELFIFQPRKLAENYAFCFRGPMSNYQEVYLDTPDKQKIHGLLFRSPVNQPATLNFFQKFKVDKRRWITKKYF